LILWGFRKLVERIDALSTCARKAASSVAISIRRPNEDIFADFAIFANSDRSDVVYSAISSDDIRRSAVNVDFLPNNARFPIGLSYDKKKVRRASAGRAGQTPFSFNVDW
jgi:hypothetical protein